MQWFKWLLSLCISVSKHGINLYAILDALDRINSQKCTLIIDQQTYSYTQIKQQTDQLIAHWSKQPLTAQTVGLFLENELQSIATLFALSRLGKHIIVVNPNLVAHKLEQLVEQKQLFLIGHSSIFEKHNFENIAIIPQELTLTAFKLKAQFFNKISVCSSGSTGVPKIATRQSKPLQAFPLLDLMLRRLKFFRINNLFIMTPLCHAAGLTAFLMAFSFKKTVYLQTRFHAPTANAMIEQYQIDCLNLVPTILQRLTAEQGQFKYVKTIISGSAPLSPQMYLEFIQNHPFIQLFNLYGSSETGINMLARPQDLQRFPESIGRAIQGVQVKILNVNHELVKEGEIGTLWTRCAWSIQPQKWMQCGDLAYKNREGYYFLKGRSDDMLICGGVNVYPIDLEHILRRHTAIADVQAFAIEDSELGQCLAVNIQLKQTMTILDIQNWIAQHAPRYLRPKQIYFVDEIQVDSVGKPLRHTANMHARKI